MPTFLGIEYPDFASQVPASNTCDALNAMNNSSSVTRSVLDQAAYFTPIANVVLTTPWASASPASGRTDDVGLGLSSIVEDLTEYMSYIGIISSWNGGVNSFRQATLGAAYDNALFNWGNGDAGAPPEGNCSLSRNKLWDIGEINQFYAIQLGQAYSAANGMRDAVWNVQEQLIDAADAMLTLENLNNQYLVAVEENKELGRSIQVSQFGSNVAMFSILAAGAFLIADNQKIL